MLRACYGRGTGALPEVDELIALIVRGLIFLNILVPALYFLLGQRDAFRCSVSLDHCRVLTGTARQVLDPPALPLISLLEWRASSLGVPIF